MSRALPFAVILKIEMAQETVSKDLCCNEDWTELLDSVDTFLIDCDGNTNINDSIDRTMVDQKPEKHF